jgi:hypothetical protein
LASGLRENPCPTWPARTAGVPSALLSSLARLLPFRPSSKGYQAPGPAGSPLWQARCAPKPKPRLVQGCPAPCWPPPAAEAATRACSGAGPAATAVVGSSRQRRSSLPSHTLAIAPRSVTEFRTRPADWRQQRRQQIRRCQRQTRRVRSSSLTRPSPKLCPDATEQGVGRAERSGLGGLAGLQR